MPEPFAAVGKFIADAIKASPRLIGAAFMICLALLILPASILASLGLEAMIRAYRPIVGLGLLATACYLITYGIHAIWNQAVTFFRGKFSARRFKKRLRHLTLDERKLFQRYVQGDTRTVRWSIESGVVNGLAMEGILYRPTLIGNSVEGFAFNMHPWVFEYAVKHPELFATPGDTTEADEFP